MIRKMYLILYLISISFADTDGPWKLSNFKGYAGEVSMNTQTEASLFYWLFERHEGDIFNDKDPLVIWFQGGPGCSGAFGALVERIGPFYIDKNLNLQPNQHPWTRLYHVMYIDYPYGAGYSYIKDPSDLKYTTEAATEYLYDFLLRLRGKYPAWFSRDIYIFGESYAGHWIPAIAYKIVKENENTDNPINLQGIGMGDPFMDGITQISVYADVAYNIGVIGEVQKKAIEKLQEKVRELEKEGEDVDASILLDQITTEVVQYSGGSNPYNARQYYESTSGRLAEWMNDAQTKALLNVPEGVEWVECNDDVYDKFYADNVTSMLKYMPLVLGSVRVLIYNGQDDLLISGAGTQEVIHNFDWEFIDEFSAAKRSLWKVGGEVAGYAQSYDNLLFVQVNKAGHLVPMDQANNAQDMLFRFVNQYSFD